MGVVGDGAGDDLGRVGAGEPQELVELVAGDVGDDAAGPVPVVEPVRASRPTGEVGAVALPVGPRPRVCTTRPIRPSRTSSPALIAQRTSKRSEKVTDQNRPDSRDGLLDLVELVEADAAGLVGDHVLAVAQARRPRWRRADRGPRPSRSGRSTDHGPGSSHHRSTITSGHRSPGRLRDRRGWVVGAESNQLTALAEQPVDLPEGV